eukprot:gene10664-10823_t
MNTLYNFEVCPQAAGTNCALSLCLEASGTLGDDAGDFTPASLMGKGAPNGPDALAHVQQQFMQHLFADSITFVGAFLIRRLLGVAHAEDMEAIADVDRRAACELKALRFGRHLLVEGAATYRLGKLGASREQPDGLWVADH